MKAVGTSMVRPWKSWSWAMLAGVAAGAVPVESALKAVALVSVGVDGEFGVGQPFAGGDLLGAGHFGGDGGGHVIAQGHDVVVGELGELFGAPFGERVGLVLGPVGAFHVIVGAEEIVDALRGVAHIGVGESGVVVGVVVLAGGIELGQCVVDAAAPGDGLGGDALQRRRAGEGAAHHDSGAEDVGSDQCGPGGDGGAEVVTDDGGGVVASDGGEQSRDVADKVEHAEFAEVDIVVGVGAGGMSVSALIGGDDVVAGVGEWEHDVAPAVGDFGEAVQEQEAGSVGIVRPGFQEVDVESVDAGDGAGADSVGQCAVGVGGGRVGHWDANRARATAVMASRAAAGSRKGSI